MSGCTLHERPITRLTIFSDKKSHFVRVIQHRWASNESRALGIQFRPPPILQLMKQDGLARHHSATRSVSRNTQLCLSVGRCTGWARCSAVCWAASPTSLCTTPPRTAGTCTARSGGGGERRPSAAARPWDGMSAA